MFMSSEDSEISVMLWTSLGQGFLWFGDKLESQLKQSENTILNSFPNPQIATASMHDATITSDNYPGVKGKELSAFWFLCSLQRAELRRNREILQSDI